jgi:hypothetical protein
MGLPEREQMTVQSKKVMVTLLWNPTGLLRIAALRKGGKFSADDYISEILSLLAEWSGGQIGATDRKFWVYFGKARPPNIKRLNKFLADNGMTRTPHAPYSPDLELCDFFLFSYIKNQLMGGSFDDKGQLLMAIKEVCESIEKAVLEKVLHEWRERLAECLMRGGRLVENTETFSS